MEIQQQLFIRKKTGKRKMILSEKKIEEIKDKIVKAISPEKIILFGSYANGIPSEESDVDLLVIMDTELRYPKQATQIRLYLDETVGVNFPMDIIVRSPEFIEERFKKGDFFIKTILEKGIKL